MQIMSLLNIWPYEQNISLSKVWLICPFLEAIRYLHSPGKDINHFQRLVLAVAMSFQNISPTKAGYDSFQNFVYVGYIIVLIILKLGPQKLS